MNSSLVAKTGIRPRPVASFMQKSWARKESDACIHLCMHIYIVDFLHLINIFQCSMMFRANLHVISCYLYFAFCLFFDAWLMHIDPLGSISQRLPSNKKIEHPAGSRDFVGALEGEARSDTRGDTPQ